MLAVFLSLCTCPLLPGSGLYFVLFAIRWKCWPKSFFGLVLVGGCGGALVYVLGSGVFMSLVEGFFWSGTLG